MHLPILLLRMDINDQSRIPESWPPVATIFFSGLIAQLQTFLPTCPSQRARQSASSWSESSIRMFLHTRQVASYRYHEYIYIVIERKKNAYYLGNADKILIHKLAIPYTCRMPENNQWFSITSIHQPYVIPSSSFHWSITSPLSKTKHGLCDHQIHSPTWNHHCWIVHQISHLHGRPNDARQRHLDCHPTQRPSIHELRWTLFQLQVPNCLALCHWILPSI